MNGQPGEREGWPSPTDAREGWPSPTDAREGWPSPSVGRGGMWTAIAVGCALVILRSAVYLLYEGSFFDSDQAIVGLMAKHLAERRAFPLFYYGQTYMLAVDAWVAAPFMLIAGPTVATLHASLVFTNCVAVALLVIALTRWGGLEPAGAVIAIAFFAFAPPLTAASLIEAGANIGPFVYVIALWFLRERPIAFGIVLGIGFLHREFTIYAVPVLLVGDALRGALWNAARIRTWLIAAVVTLATWQSVQALKPFADLMGPGTRGELVHGSGGSQVGNIAQRVSLRPAEYPARARVMFTEHLPRLFGAARTEHQIASQGRDWLFWVLSIGLGAALARAVVRAARARRQTPGFGFYLVGVGITAAAGYIATRPGSAVVDRYILLTLLIPVGCVAVSLATERSRAWRLAVIALVAAWASSAAVDHLAHARRYIRGQPDDIRVLADTLVRRNVRVAEAPYWRAYKLTFLTGERVIVASTDVVRIQQYRRLAARAGSNLVQIVERPCTGGERVALWYLCRPGTY